MTRKGPLRPSPKAGTTLALLGCAAALTVLYIVAVRTGVGQRVDRAAVLHHHLDRTPDADVTTSNRTWLLATVSLAPAVIWCGRRDRRKLLVNGCAAAASVLVAEVSRNMLARPSLGPFDPFYGASFPIGHAAAAMGLALALVALADGTWVWRLVPAIPGPLPRSPLRRRTKSMSARLGPRPAGEPRAGSTSKAFWPKCMPSSICRGTTADFLTDRVSTTLARERSRNGAGR